MSHILYSESLKTVFTVITAVVYLNYGACSAPPPPSNSTHTRRHTNVYLHFVSTYERGACALTYTSRVPRGTPYTLDDTHSSLSWLINKTYILHTQRTVRLRR